MTGCQKKRTMFAMDEIVQQQKQEDQTIYSWKAPLRPFRRRSTTLLRFFLALALLISAIVFFFGDLVTIIPVWALLFLFYVFAITPPPIVESHITRFGVETMGVSLRWGALSHYYFVDRFGYQILVLVTHGPYYAHSYLVMPDIDTRNTINGILNQHLMFLKSPPVTFTDKVIKILSKLVPEDVVEESKQVKTDTITTTLPQSVV